MEEHQKFLTRHCRVCTKKVGRVWYQVKNYNKLLSILGVDTSNDEIDIHPQCFCNSCYLTSRRMYSKTGEGSKSTTTIQPYTWMEHNEDGCEVCDLMTSKAQGGRPKKSSSGRGRPCTIEKHVWSCAGKSTLETITPESIIVPSGMNIDNFLCCSCHMVVNRPLELTPCRNLICMKCCLPLIKSNEFTCPGCTLVHDSSISNINTIAPLIQTMICNIQFQCLKCNKVVRLDDATDHDQSECSSFTISLPLTVEDVLHQPLESEPTKLEQLAAVNVVQRMMTNTSDSTVTLPTGGHVSTILC